MTKRLDERRELLKEDDIHSFLEQVARYIQQNFMKVLLGTVAVFALIALFFVWQRNQAEQKDQKAQALYSAEKILVTDPSDATAEKFGSEKERYEKALAELTAVIDTSSGVIQQQALMRKANVLIHLGRQSEIEALYKEVIRNDQGLKLYGLVGLANYYQGEGKYKEAMEQFNLVESVPGAANLKDLVRFKKAQCLKEEGDLSGAKKELNLLVDAFANETDAANKPPILTKAQQLLDEVDKQLASSGESAS